MKADNKYISYIDGFRGYAILLVIISHLHLAQMDVAFLGVTLFFFLSGFLITKLMIAEFEKKGTVKLKDFYIRRVLRLYPGLIFMLLISILTLVFFKYSIIWTDIFAGLFYFTNYYLVYFSPALADVNYLLVSKILWSLSVEEHFYLFFPILFILFYSNSTNTFKHILVALLFVFLMVRMVTYFSLEGGEQIFKATYYTTHCRADSILYGCLSAVLIYKYATKWYLKMLNSVTWFILAVLVLISSLIINDLFFLTTVKYSFQGLAFCILVPAFPFLFQQGFLRNLIDNKIMVYIGKLSYSLYLFHWVALKIGNIYINEINLNWYLLVTVLTLLLSVISYHFIEKPFMGLRKRFGSNIKIMAVR